MTVIKICFITWFLYCISTTASWSHLFGYLLPLQVFSICFAALFC